MNISAQIKGLSYKPLLCAERRDYAFKDLEEALKNSVFNLNAGKDHKIAVSRWVSPKRTRSYPYARVYDTLSFSGRRITIIPIVKDEGKRGDRDFLQWDTISLMSLIGIYAIIGYYTSAERNARHPDKITNQQFDARYLKKRIREILSYQSDALHWNLSEIDRVGSYVQRALENYETISKKTGVEMHSHKTFERRITKLRKGAEEFRNLSRQLAKDAQMREIVTVQPKERLAGTKASVTIKNYLGGLYYFTADEVELKGTDIHLIEAKHARNALPSIDDIKDALIKMLLYTNLQDVEADGKKLNAKAVLKLTVGKPLARLSVIQEKTLTLLKEEAQKNNFQIRMRQIG